MNLNKLSVDLINKLSADIINKKYTDTVIKLIDPNKSLEMHVHKNILALSSDYFDRLFNFGNAKDKSLYEIYVDNVHIAYQVI